jgi:hypothetical protein
MKNFYKVIFGAVVVGGLLIAAAPQPTSITGSQVWTSDGTNITTTTTLPIRLTNALTIFSVIQVLTNAVTTPPAAVASYGLLWNSNYALYWITPSHTNLLSAP